MKKIEIEAAISSYLEKHPIILKDLLNSSVKLNSYEVYIQELHYIKNTFKNIPEFVSNAQEYINKMDSFIGTCNFDDMDTLSNHINSRMHNSICGYSSSISINALISQSLGKSVETSIEAIEQIYVELGYKSLLHYIELLNNPWNFSNYINSSDLQLVAMHYLLYKTNHHSNSKLKRNLSVAKFHQIMQNNLSNSLSEITSEKNDFISFMDKEKQQFQNWFVQASEKANTLYNESHSEYQTFMEEARSSIEQLKKTYSDELKLKDPATFMKDKAREYRNNAISWAGATLVLTVVLLLLLYLILDPEITYTKKLITIHFFSSDMPIYSSVIIFSMIGLVVYIVRLFIKMAVSSKHLSDEYYQKYTLTYFYLSLLFEGKLEQKQADVILATLFTKADTGLLKNDNSSDTELITKLFSMMK